MGDRTEAASLLLAMSRFSSGVGLIPEQNWELPDLDASPFGTDPTIAFDRLRERRRSRLRLAPDLVRGLVREARARPGHRPERRAAER